MNKLLHFIIRYHFVLLFLLLEGIAIGFVQRNTYYQGAKITTATNQTTGFLHSQIYSVVNYFYLKQENERLANENMQLKNQSSAIYLPVVVTRDSISDTTLRLNYKYITAKIVYNSLSNRDNYVMINIGSDHGILPDMGVVSSDGIIGTVIDVSKHYSLIMSVLHKDNRVSVKLKKNNTIGSLIWEGGSYKTAIMVDVPSHVDIKVGDTIVTSGYSSGFPENVMVGFVKKIAQDKGVGLEVQVALSSDMNKVSHVYVVQDYFKNEKQELLHTPQKSTTTR